jgi:plastocyanin
MTRMRIGAVIGLAVLAVALAGCGGSDDDASGTTETTTTSETTTDTTATSGNTLTASVGPGFEISLTGADGAAVSSLPAGDYTIEVDDQSDIHNFHLTGPGVNVKTDVSQTGTKTFTVTLKKGTYRFVCDPHASQMKGSFKVS